MPLYEYVCDQDGTVLELIRPMSKADDPVTDPLNKNRRFKRRLSTFAAGGDSQAPAHSLLSRNSGSCCPCGKSHGSCASKN